MMGFTLTVRRPTPGIALWRLSAGGSGWLVAVLAGAAHAAVACGAEDETFVSPSAIGGSAGAPAAGGATLGNEGGSAVGTVFLGRRCITTVDCGHRLECLTVDSGVFAGEGPPGGYCTVPCDDDPGICEGFAPGATCQALGASAATGRFCGLGCVLGANGRDGKCHERRDTACVVSPTAPESGVCVPRCNSDTDCCAPGVVCGPARFCDHASGLCAPQRATGLGVGAPCSGTADDACRGICREVPGADPARFACSEPCTFGASPACGFVPEEGVAAAYCYDADDPTVAAGRVAGDGGWCVATCDCGADCSEGLLCRAFDEPGIELATGRLGTCAGAALVDDPLPCDAPASGGTFGEGGGAIGTSGSGVAGGAGGTVGTAGESSLGGEGGASSPGGNGGAAGGGGDPAGNGGTWAPPGGAAGAGGVGVAGHGAAGAHPRAGTDVGGATAGSPPQAGLPPA